jgi:hypothetical protein
LNLISPIAPRSISIRACVSAWYKNSIRSVPFLAYKIQENAYGGLKPSTRSQLRRIAIELEKSTASPEFKVRRKLKSGTRILREWHGQTHEVIVTESGYEYGGAGYRSLSEVARKITGARWSGPAFFRLNQTPSVGSGSDV